jgi:hypothetical protein
MKPTAAPSEADRPTSSLLPVSSNVHAAAAPENRAIVLPQTPATSNGALRALWASTKIEVIDPGGLSWGSAEQEFVSAARRIVYRCPQRFQASDLCVDVSDCLRLTIRIRGSRDPGLVSQIPPRASLGRLIAPALAPPSEQPDARAGERRVARRVPGGVFDRRGENAADRAGAGRVQVGARVVHFRDG